MSCVSLSISFCCNVQQSTAISWSAIFLLLSPLSSGHISPKRAKGSRLTSLDFLSPAPPKHLKESNSPSFTDHAPKTLVQSLWRAYGTFWWANVNMTASLLKRDAQRRCGWGKDPMERSPFALQSQEICPSIRAPQLLLHPCLPPRQHSLNPGRALVLWSKGFTAWEQHSWLSDKRDGSHLGWRGRVRGHKARHRHTLWKR